MSSLKTGIIGSPLDTLEVTVPIQDKKQVGNTELLYRSRQRSKAISTSVNGKLLYLGSPLHKSYQKAYYCNSHLFQDGKRVTSEFCKKRSCVVCSRVYAARLMAAYMEPLMSLDDLHLVTVTDVNVKSKELSNEVDRLLHNYRLIYKSMNSRGKKIKGFFKLEITHSTKRDDFNPHIHMLISGKEHAKEFVKGWLQRNPTANANAQNIRKVRDKGALIEVFKYVTKAIISDTFDSRSLDAMYQAIDKRQVYRAIGIKKVEDTKMNDYETKVITHKSERIEVWKWSQDRKDWYTSEGESFNNTEICKDAKKMIKIVEKSKNHVIKKQAPKYEGPDIHDILKQSKGKSKEPLF